MIAKFQLIDFSKLNFSKLLNQSFEYFLLVKLPLQPFLLSYEIKPSLKVLVAIF